MPQPTFSSRVFRFLAYLTFITTFLVILAGSVVRTTQSGMGCPDWPRCFGYFIPPTEQGQVTFTPGNSYQKGIMIIRDDTLWRATGSFTATEEFNRQHWEKYPKHTYASFDAYQTWIEYINRLLGALLGIFVFALVLSSFTFWKSNRPQVFLSLSLLVLTGFQAWLGKLVVDGNLIPGSITIHMLAALLLLALSLAILFRLDLGQPFRLSRNQLSLFTWLTILVISLTLIQIVIGTQVREEIDELGKTLGFENRGLWIEALSNVFKLHRSFSILLIAVNGFLIFRIFKSEATSLRRFAVYSGVLILLEPAVGVFLAYFEVPAFAQPVHLLLACLLFTAQVSLLLEIRKGKRL